MKLSISCLGIIFLGLSCFLSSLSIADDWPTYRADAARSGYIAQPLPKSLNLQWTYKARHAPRPAWPTSDRIHFDFANQPIIVGTTVVFGTSANDKVIALDLENGTQRWAFFAEGPVRFAPAAWRDRVFVASDDGWLYALSLADGKLLWKHRGGPNDRKFLGNDRMISRWPARGGPVVLGTAVYYAAGIWPSDDVYIYALDAQSGKVIWSNDRTGGLYIAQPHGGSDAKSGVAPQGYLLANDTQLFVPTGRAVPAVFNRADGELLYYHLGKNHSIGGARAMLADQFLCNGGCLFDQQSGLISARCGRGILTATHDGIIQSDHSTMLGYRWKDMQTVDGKGKPLPYRGLEKYCEITLDPDWQEPKALAVLFQKFPKFKTDLYDMLIRFKEISADVLRQNALEVTLHQRRPEIQALGLQPEPFFAATYEKRGEVIVAGGDAICGTAGRVRVADLAAQKVRWSYSVKGTALGLAVSRERLIVSTDHGMIYCFGKEKTKSHVRNESDSDVDGSVQNSAVNYKEVAKEILKKGVTEGLCVDLGSEEGDLALALAKQSKLQICAVESDGDKVAKMRRKLDAAGFYGVRVTVHQANPKNPSYPEYCANLIVSSQALTAGLPDSSVMNSIQRPRGGITCVG
ncbi:MAG: PQQ-binding-like beta-propeller repeat protein, partial [Kiritimatiellae bacterium]|nr:PQQ-binding-like beta-propeller repeat protein [Kiritimatiellia bacterium]